MKDKNLNESQTIIGHAVSVEGDFTGEGDVIIEGKLKGNIKTTHSLRVGKDAEIEANISAENAIISGFVKGDIKITNNLEVTKTAKIEGNIACEILSIEPGSYFQGNCQMSKSSKVEKS